MSFSIKKILDQETTKIKKYTFVTMVFVFAILLCGSFYYEYDYSKQNIIAWSNKYKTQIAEYLFVENALSIQGLTHNYLEGKNKLKFKSINVYDTKGHLLSGQGPTLTTKNFKSGFNSQILKGEINFAEEIKLDDKNLGYLTITALYNLQTLFNVSFFLIALFSATLVIINIFYKTFINVLRNSMIEPLVSLQQQVNEKYTSDQPFNFDYVQDLEVAEEVIDIASTLENNYKSIQKLQQIKEEQARLMATGKLAAQVAHDIRSPLTALNVILSVSKEYLPEEQKQLVKSVSQRINDIADDLLAKTRPHHSWSDILIQTRVEYLPYLTTEIFNEKRIQYMAHPNAQIELNIDKGAYMNAFAKINVIEFKRVLSNLINNSIESQIDNKPILVKVDIHTTAKEVKITISDNGSGCPTEVIEKLGNTLSVGKKQGSGLGLSHAYTNVQYWSGQIQISSQPNLGTKIEITLPISATTNLRNSPQQTLS